MTEIPAATVNALARSIFKEASTYGFDQVDFIRLMNELMDLCTNEASPLPSPASNTHGHQSFASEQLCSLPLRGERVAIRQFNGAEDAELLQRWLPEKYGRYLVIYCATAQSITIDALTVSPGNHLGIITLLDGTPIGAMAMLDHSTEQKRAELRKLIGDPDYRGQGIAEEATRLWIQYGIQGLGLEKIYVSTLQTQIANIKLNENIGFKVEGLLKNEVLIDDERRDVLRMGYCATGN